MKNLDDISPTMCLAKWTEGTLYISSGMTQSCHLVKKNRSPVDLVLKDPANLFNTPQKKKERKLMLDGVRQPGCASCNKVEKTKNAISDRMWKNNHHFIHKEDVLAVGYEGNLNPTELEIGFDNTCNLKCMYCNPSNSSSWVSETLQYGIYPGDQGAIEERLSIEDQEIYTKAFWDWFPTVYHGLKVLRVTGGEPFLSKQTLKLLDYIIANPNLEIQFAINSNFSISNKILDPYIEKIGDMIDKKAIKNIKIFTSMESAGERAEYIRYGLDYELWKQNFIYILERFTDVKIVIMSTYNVLSVTSFDSLLEFVEELKAKYQNRVSIDPVQMKGPYFLTIDIIHDRPELLSYIEKTAQRMKEHGSYTNLENIRIQRIYQVSKSLSNNDVAEKRKIFIKFINEYDRRKKTDFLSTFPEMESFYYDCFKTK
jgi:organic radical activating enzyme